MSSYRLGDFFWGNLHWRDRLELVCTHRDSLAADYFRTHASHSVHPRHRISSAGDAIAALAASAVRSCSNCSLPPDIEASVALHLRVGDVICGSSLAERHRRPLSPNLYAPLIPARTHVYVFAASHFSAASSTNSVRCGHSTREYIKQILHVSKGTLAPPASVDCDLCSVCVPSPSQIPGSGERHPTENAVGREAAVICAAQDVPVGRQDGLEFPFDGGDWKEVNPGVQPDGCDARRTCQRIADAISTCCAMPHIMGVGSCAWGEL